MVRYFEGIDSERGIGWRASDSLSIRSSVRIALDESVADHSTISRTRRLMDVETHQAVFQWVLQVLAEKKLLKGTTIGVDATTLEANAALRSIVRRDTGERYEEFLMRLAKESGIETPTREQLAKLDRKRPKKGSNDDWTHPHDPDARITKMKGWSHASGSQGRACRGHGDRGDCRRHAARCRCWRHRDDSRNSSRSRRAYYQCGGGYPRRRSCKAGQHGRAARSGHRQGLSQPRVGERTHRVGLAHVL